jgi:hypothetical protein
MTLSFNRYYFIDLITSTIAIDLLNDFESRRTGRKSEGELTAAEE